MLLFGWSPLGRQLPNLPDPLLLLLLLLVVVVVVVAAVVVIVIVVVKFVIVAVVVVRSKTAFIISVYHWFSQSIRTRLHRCQ